MISTLHDDVTRNMLSPTLLQLSLSDMDRVLEERWLSDASVNAYLDLVQV